MDSIEWTDEFSVGIPLIDQQHRKLVTMINAMITNSAAKVYSETVSDVLTEMTRYAQEHFATEEQLLSENGYPLLENHRQSHKEYRRKTVDLCTATTVGAEVVPQVMLNYLYNWWQEHILQEDMKYKSFFAERTETP